MFSGPGPGWTLASVADFNGDGMTGILWSDTNGALTQWQMDGAAYIGGGSVAGAPGWSLINKGQLVA